MEEDCRTEGYQCNECGGYTFFEHCGLYFCKKCETEAKGIMVTDVPEEDFISRDGNGGLYNPRFSRSLQSACSERNKVNISSLMWYRFMKEECTKEIAPKKELNHYFNTDQLGPSEPEDFASTATKTLVYDDYINEVRGTYVMGLQCMLQLQCESLVEQFNVSPLICGVASAVWLRFLVTTEVFQDTWADEILTKSESPNQGGEPDCSNVHNDRDEPYNACGQRAVMVWFRRLREVIPLDHSLAICFLACHVAREAILPTDIVKWSVEGKLPYFGAHVEIAKHLEQPSLACPISPALLFRPSQPVPIQKLEAMAARIAKRIGLNLPPVNFYVVACRYLNQLCVPSEKILLHACSIYEWSMPPELWLSANELRLPTRVCVMSILIVSIRILYNINGFGAWERSLSKGVPSGARGDTGFPLHEMTDSRENFIRNESVRTSVFDSEELLQNLEAGYNEIEEPCEFTKDLMSYLRYCKDVVFVGARSSSHKDQVVEELLQKLWDFYHNAKEPTEEDLGTQRDTFNPQRSASDDACYFSTQSTTRSATKQFTEMSHEVALQDLKNSDRSNEIAIRKLKSDMEDNRFCYIPPRVNVKRSGYLQYTRKQDKGILRYVAHADYYILLRFCAKVAGVDTRIMHIAVLGLERRLAWLEKRIDHCLHLTPPSISCEFCRGVTESECCALG